MVFSVRIFFCDSSWTKKTQIHKLYGKKLISLQRALTCLQEQQEGSHVQLDMIVYTVHMWFAFIVLSQNTACACAV